MRNIHTNYVLFSILFILATFCEIYLLMLIVLIVVIPLEIIVIAITYSKDYISNNRLFYLIDKKYLDDIIVLPIIALSIISYGALNTNNSKYLLDLRLRLCCAYLVGMILSYVELSIIKQINKQVGTKIIIYLANIILGLVTGLIVGCL